MPTFFCQAQLFSSKKSINNSTGNLPSVIDSGNLDNDSNIDIVIGTTYGGTIEWYKNNGNGTFSLQTLVTSTLTGVLGLAIADLDNDLDNDIVASSYFSGQVVWYENDGSGNFGSAQLIASGIGEAGTVKVGKIDNNNTIDVVVAAGASGEVRWFSNNGNGTFTSSYVVGNNGLTPRSIDLADFNGDGDLDVVVGFRDTQNVELYENQLANSGSTTFLRDANGSISSSNSDLNEVSFGDVDNDNNLDIIKVNKNGMTSWYKKESNGTFSEHNLSTTYSKPATAMVADYDDDSTNDIIVGYANSGTDPLTWRDNSGPESLIDNTQDDINQITINDFDGDGDLDVASISQGQNDLNWFENLTYSPSLSVVNKNITSFKVYPNPAKNEINFQVNNFSNNFNVDIFNVTGKKIIEATISIGNPKLDISSLSKGVYLLNIKDFSTTLKFVKL
ncbi:hypothetical protein GCM10022257_23990 [Hyunsoonleella aestuarii]|uniref:Secretion system C-terminal sorting domain-containing protein n=2 Tax=Hyunsoonleella aestuarii TaxID=912802 RepID=A0ABP8EDK0_9FLAO